MSSYLPLVARVILGLSFTVFGLNFFFPFLPPPAMPEPAERFLGALVEAGWLLPFVKTVEVGAGLLLLANRFVPLMLTLLAPIVVNIVGFHMFLAPDTIALTLVLLALTLYLAWTHRASYAPMLRAQACGDAEATSGTDLSSPAASR